MNEKEKEKTVRDIVQMLNGLKYSDAHEILREVDDKVLGSLKVILPEDEQQSFDKPSDIH
ncbi:MAG: hypothetical protein IJQ82_15630 [Selenomonadaceae bacterium]|nr:hypothetical protein [Selenomonadaceae bacterium]